MSRRTNVVGGDGRGGETLLLLLAAPGGSATAGATRALILAVGLQLRYRDGCEVRPRERPHAAALKRETVFSVSSPRWRVRVAWGVGPRAPPVGFCSRARVPALPTPTRIRKTRNEDISSRRGLPLRERRSSQRECGRSSLGPPDAKFQFDTVRGSKPAVVHSPGEVVGYSVWQLEVHAGQAGVGPLLESFGWYGFGAPSTYAYGMNPALAKISFDEEPDTVLEVHQSSTAGFGPLAFMVGTIAQHGTSVSWTQPIVYDYGYRPAVAVNSAGTSIVEVHQGQVGLGPLWYHVGTIDSVGNVTWQTNAVHYGDGANPAIAMIGNSLIEVHQSTSNAGPLWYRTGTLENGIVEWDRAAVQYDYGAVPSISIVNNKVVEVHQGETGSGLSGTMTLSSAPRVPH